MPKKVKREVMVRVSEVVKNKVAKKVAGIKTTIGEFYDVAALEKLYPLKPKK